MNYYLRGYVVYVGYILAMMMLAIVFKWSVWLDGGVCWKTNCQWLILLWI